MTSWKKERDRLVEQTLAFVQSVTATHALRSLSSSIDPEIPEASLAAKGSTDVPAPVTSASQVDASTDSAPALMARQTAPCVAASPLPSARLLPPFRSEREEIMRRVAAFRAHQGKLIKEREAYYLEMQAKIRTGIRNDSDADRL